MTDQATPQTVGAPALSLPVSIAYGSGSIATGLFLILPQLLLMFFMTEVLAIPAAAAGMALLAPKVLELITDPLIGRWSDSANTRWGRWGFIKWGLGSRPPGARPSILRPRPWRWLWRPTPCRRR